MRWVRQYKRKRSNALPIIKRIRRREEMVNKRVSRNKAAKKAELPADKHFILSNGSSVKSIEELAMMLDVISDAEFSHHVNDAKNDFSNWIRDVFGEAGLADSLAGSRDKKESQIMLLKHALSSK